MEEEGGSPGDCLRGYQQEMLDASLRGNAIVVMPTGSGKTMIAAARIRVELERSDPGKLVWFLANSIELGRQQLSYLQAQLPAYQMLSLTGQDGVDNWSSQHLWDAVLAGVRVVVGTPAVLKDALSHGFVRISRLALLVFDEAHHCIGNHPMNAIMKNAYHPAKSRGERIPAILGLTASPAINAKKGSLDQLEASLDASVATPKQSLEELMRFVYPVPLQLITYPPSNLPEYPGASRLLCALEQTSSGYDFSSDPYVQDLRRYGDDRSQRALQKIFEKGKTRCSEQIRTLNRRATTLYDQLGAASAVYYVSDCVDRFSSGTRYDMMLPDTTMSEHQHLLDILQKIMSASEPLATATYDSTTSHKAELLVSLLHEQSAEFIDKGKTMLFAKERATVVGLTRLLRDSTRLAMKYRVGGFVGTSSFESRKSIADLAEPRQQMQDLKDFKDGTKNLMVATSVLEEGIDVRECNLVINFDAPDTLIGYIQRRGRARMQQSKYYVLAAEDDVKIDPLKWQAQENRMQAEYRDALRERVAAESLDEAAVNTRVYRVESTGAMVTFEDAKAHLHHFCSVSIRLASNYVDTRPDYFPQKTADGRGWTATVTLPSFIDPKIRTASSREVWNSEGAAIKDAAFEAYVALHKAEMLNDNLLPFKEPGPEDGGQHVDQPGMLEVAERLSSWTELAAEAADGTTTWHSTLVTICGIEGLEPVKLVLPAQIVQDDSFTLFWNEQISYSVTVSSTHAVSVGPAQIEALRRDTDVAQRTVHGSRMPSDERIDTLLLMDLPTAPVSGYISAMDLSSNVFDGPNKLGLMHVDAQHTRPFMLQRLESRSTDDGLIEQRMVVRRFPKRTDFLHPVPQGQSVSRVPLKTCLFAAFLPSIAHRIDVRLLAQRLQRTILKDIDITNTALIIEALSSPSADEASDYNRLEFLGDAILKFCASLQVTAQHTTWPERYLTLEKVKRVSNSALFRAALRLGLDKYIITKSFTGVKWRPAYVSELQNAVTGTRKMSSKALADVVEALIGAAYVDGGLDKAFRCIKTFLPDETWYTAPESFLKLTTDLAPCDHHSLDTLERLIGHHFTHPTLLVEAVTHASLPFQRTGMSYERLEFLGDAVLDLILVPKLHAHSRKLRHFELHSMHEALVNGLFLGYRCMSYGVEQEWSSVVKEGSAYDVKQSKRTLHLHDFLRASGRLLEAKQDSLDRFETYNNSITGALHAGEEYPWPDLLALKTQKFFSDLIESVLGALYIDTHGDLAVCEAFLEKLGIMAQMRSMLDGEMEVMSPKERVGIAAGNAKVKYQVNTERIEGRPVVHCSVIVDESVVAESRACGSRAEAEARAACEAVRILQSRSPASKRRRLDEVSAGKTGPDAVVGAQRGHV
ncbi:Dicer-like protein 2 [Teratosphaeriaceae sp. CCFEE 6253]|nr:Dicer-like protein 2 [Teratosphaeriaceae sp. CCFEE 6253]